MGDQENNMQGRIETVLFLLRLGVFIVMMAWSIDKIFNPGHGVAIFEGYYFIKDFSSQIMTGFGVIEAGIMLAFMAGLWKKYTYGFVMIVHGLSTFSTWEAYLKPSLLFYAAWPMLAACVGLYMLRDLDVKYTIGQKTAASGA